MAHPKPPSPTDPKHSEARAAMGMAAVISVAEDDKTIKAARVGAGAAANASPATVAAAAATGTASSPAPPTSSPPSALPPWGNRPSYFTTRESSNYEAAKRLLSGGDFEATLSTIETGMKQLASFLEVNGVSGDGVETHASLAPLNYQYGSTLLYSVEEGGGGEDAMMMGGQQQVQPSDEVAEDLQIAWENLELARSIIDRLLSGSEPIVERNKDSKAASGKNALASAFAANAACGSITSTSTNRNLLRVDLAQIHLRLADLQMANGAYRSAMEDYTVALTIRTELLGKYDRKVADVHYQLGVTAMMLAAEGEKSLHPSIASTAAAQPDNPLVAALGAAVAEARREDELMGSDEIRMLRLDSVRHYLDCGRSFGGKVALLCGADPEEVVGKEDASRDTKGDDAESTAYATASKSLEDIRAKCADLANGKKPAAGVGGEKKTCNDDVSSCEEALADILELLDELQETIDHTEADLRGVIQVHEMKVQMEEEVRAADDIVGGQNQASGDDSGAVTTIGFAPPPLEEAATFVGRSMMVVKKKEKKKRVALNAVASACTEKECQAAKRTKLAE